MKTCRATRTTLGGTGDFVVQGDCEEHGKIAASTSAPSVGRKHLETLDQAASQVAIQTGRDHGLELQQMSRVIVEPNSQAKLKEQDNGHKRVCQIHFNASKSANAWPALTGKSNPKGSDTSAWRNDDAKLLKPLLLPRLQHLLSRERLHFQSPTPMISRRSWTFVNSDN